MPAPLKYATTWDRLVATSEPESDLSSSCWNSTLKMRCRYGYARLKFYVPGLKRAVTMTAHVVAMLCVSASVSTVDDLYLEYLNFRCSGLEVDHLCCNSRCCNPDHVEAVTPSENCKRRDNRRKWGEYR